MENQARYDLNAAIENWRQELDAQLNLPPDVRRELESHLRDAIAGFQQHGLSDEDSFWLARRRLGPLRQLGEEFAKADPVGLWRERIFWMGLAVFLMVIFNCYVTAALGVLRPIDPARPFAMGSWARWLWSLLTPLVIMIIAALMRSEKIVRRISKLRPLFENPFWLSFALVLLVALTSGSEQVSEWILWAKLHHSGWQTWGVGPIAALYDSAYLLIFAAVIIFLLPTGRQKSPATRLSCQRNHQ